MVEYESEGIDITIRAMMTGLSRQYVLARWFSDDGVPPEVCMTDQAWRAGAKISALAWLEPVGVRFRVGMCQDPRGLVAR